MEDEIECDNCGRWVWRNDICMWCRDCADCCDCE